MRMQNRSLVVATLALSLATLSGCAALPGSLFAGRSEAGATARETSSLKVLVDSGAYQTQGVDLSAIAIHVKLEFPYQSDSAPLTLDVRSGVPAVFKDLAPGHARITVSALNVVTNQVVDAQSRWIDLLPGVQAAAQFALTVGGSTAADVGFTFGSDTRDYRLFDQNDGLDPDFRAAAENSQSNGGRRVMPFQLVTREGMTPLVFTADMDHLERQIGNLPSVSFPPNSWYQLPAHAERVDSEPFMGHDKVRHFRWSNTLEIAGQSHLYTFERWVTPFDGMIKETVTENGEVISTLSRAPFQIAGKLLQNGAPLNMPFPVGLRRWDGTASVPVNAGTTRDPQGTTLFFGLTPGQYQLVYDASMGYQDPSLAALVVSEPVQISGTSPVPFGLELGWNLAPSIGGPSAKHDFMAGVDTFGFASKAGAPNAEYQVTVASASFMDGHPIFQPVWSSPWGPAGGVGWNGQAGQEAPDRVGTDVPPGEYAYLVKFRKQGTAFGGAGYFGQSQWQPFRLTRGKL